MTPSYAIRKKSENTRTIKYMSICHDPRVQRMLLQSANDSVYKAICNAFLNVAQNPEIQLPRRQQKRFKRFNPLIHRIIAPNLSLKQKRKYIQRGGGFFLGAILPAVLSTALGFLGSALMKKLSPSTEESK